MKRIDRTGSACAQRASRETMAHRLAPVLAGALAVFCLAAPAAAQDAAKPAASKKDPYAGKIVLLTSVGGKYIFDPVPGPNLQAQNGAGQPGNISGVWLPQGAPPRPGEHPGEGLGWYTVEGDPPPLTPWAADIVAERRKMAANGMPFAGTMAACLPYGMPAMGLREPYPIQIIQSPGQVTMLHELMRDFRLVYLDEQLPDSPDPSYQGTSVGRWDGDTLVVTTVAIREETTLGTIPHSDQLQTVERIRRLDPETLEVLMTLTDAKAFTKPWTTRVVSKLMPKGGRLLEYTCAQNQRNPVDDTGKSGADLK